MSDLPAVTHPLPAPTPDAAWPGLTWPTGLLDDDRAAEVDRVLDEAFATNPNRRLRLSLATVVVQHGRIVAERYGPGTDAATRLISWSTAKSVTQAALGLAVGDGLLDLDAPGVAPEWSDPTDPRHAITLRHLLAMRSGLEFNEDYVDAGTSHCLEMLFGSGATDMAHYAASQSLAQPVDTHFNYASGTTNIVSRAVATAFGCEPEGAGLGDVLRQRLFAPLGMDSADPRVDGAGTFVGSSYLYATARDFARFGLLYLRDGVWDGRRLLPEGWVDLARTPTSKDPDEELWYGSHWWVWGDRYGTFAAQGYEGQLIAVVPALDAVIVRLGKTPIEHRPALVAWYRRLLDALAG